MFCLFVCFTVLKTGPDRPVRPVQPGTGSQSDPVKTPKTSQKPGLNRKLKKTVLCPVRFLKPRFVCLFFVFVFVFVFFVFAFWICENILSYSYPYTRNFYVLSSDSFCFAPILFMLLMFLALILAFLSYMQRFMSVINIYNAPSLRW